MKNAKNHDVLAALIRLAWHLIDNIGTIYRQTLYSLFTSTSKVHDRDIT